MSVIRGNRISCCQTDIQASIQFMGQAEHVACMCYQMWWAAQMVGAPEPDELCQQNGYAVPDYVSSYSRPSVS